MHENIMKKSEEMRVWGFEGLELGGERVRVLETVQKISGTQGFREKYAI